MIRTHYFLSLIILDSDPELQKRGIVFVYYDTAQPENNVNRLSMSEYIEFLKVFTTFPCRYSSNHLCLKKGKDTLALNNAVVACATRMIPLYTRVRTRFHYGSDMELQYALQDHGISLKTCPVDENGVVRQDIAKIWYEESVVNGLFKGDSNASDENGSSITEVAYSDVLLGVGQNDVLLGRGTVVQFRPGNIRFRKLVAEHLDAYDQARRAAKRRIVAEVSQTLKSNGVRFLKTDSDEQWIECDGKEVEKTIAQQFRSARKEKKRS